MTRVAAIDCGTNSIRLLISAIDSEKRVATDVYRTMKTVRLGEGIDANRTFTSAALARTFAACDEYAKVISDADVAGVRFVATSASRDASNRDEFVAGVLSRIGVEPEVISGEEEAELTFRGALMTHGDRVGPEATLVVDIGGGSTEFVKGSSVVGTAAVGTAAAGILAAKSVDVGCVRMTERHLHSDPPSFTELADAIADIDAAIIEADEVVDLRSASTLIGVAGSVTTVCALALGLPRYDEAVIDGSSISRAQVATVTADLLAMTRAQRAALPVMHSGRVDVIGGGALILDRIVKFVGCAEVVASEHDILDGIAWSIVDRGQSA